MRSRLESDHLYDSPFFPRASSPYQLEGRGSIDKRRDDRFYMHRPDDVEDISDSFNGPITVSITPSESPPPSPPSPTSFVSFNSSESSDFERFTLHPMSSSTSISSSRSMPVQPSRSAVDMYVYHNVKPNTLAKKRKVKPKALLVNRSSPCLDDGSTKKSRNEETENVPTGLLRSNSISSSLRVFTGSLRRKSSTHLTAPTVTITPSTPTITSPVSPLSPMSPPLSPLSPMEPPSEAERRLRQLHKVSRTLGENIPSELIFGASEPEEVYASPRGPKKTKTTITKFSRSHHRASLSISSYTPFIVPTSDESNHTDSTPSSPSSMAFEIDFVDNPRPGSTILSPITFAVPAPPTPPQPLHTLPDFPEDVSANGSPHSPVSRPTSPESNPILRMLSRPGTPFFDSAVPIESNRDQLEVDRSAIRRERRQGWSGEWNREDMQDVIAKLRTLK